MALERSDYSSRARAPDGKREVQYPSPNVSNLVVVESVPIKPDSYEALPYGSPHPDYAGTGLILVKQRQVKATNNQVWVVRVYASRNINEDWYDYTLRYSGDVVANPIFIRTYHKLRNDFQPLTKGAPFKGVYRMIVTDGGANYTSAPTVIFTGANTTPAAANAIMSPPDDTGKMTLIGLELTDEGDGYAAAPTISFTGGGGSGAAATAYIQPAAAILVKEELVELENEAPDLASLFVKVTRVYETLPGPIFHWEDYEDQKIQGQRSRGKVHRTSQSVYRTGSELPSFSRVGSIGSSVATKTWYEPRGESAIVMTMYVETWTEIAIHDEEMTEEWGGGILSVDETRAAPGIQTPDEGYLVAESLTRTVSPDEQIKTTKQLISDTAWPETTGCQTDEKFGIVVDIAKKVVPAGTAYPGAVLSLVTPYVDIQPHSKYRSIQINSKVRLPLPADEFYPIERPLHVPGSLISVEAVWDDAVFKSVSAQALTAHASVSSGAGGGVIVRHTGGFHGLAIGIARRIWTFGPPLLSDLPTPIQFLTSAGTVVLFSTHSGTSYTAQDDGGLAFSDSYQNQIHSHDVEGLLVSNAFPIINTTHFSPPQSAIAVSGGGSIAAVAADGTLSYMTVQIPPSNPMSIGAGSTISGGGYTLDHAILIDVIVERWRLGVWSTVLEYVAIPAALL